VHHAATLETFVSRSMRVEQSRESATTGDEKWRSRTALIHYARFSQDVFSKL
jgi:hypothetical protein